MVTSPSRVFDVAEDEFAVPSGGRTLRRMNIRARIPYTVPLYNDPLDTSLPTSTFGVFCGVATRSGAMSTFTGTAFNELNVANDVIPTVVGSEEATFITVGNVKFSAHSTVTYDYHSFPNSS